MYYANLRNNRVVVKCTVLNGEKIKFVSAVYDTGARYSCFSANIIDHSLSEKDVEGAEYKMLAGFIGEEASKFYKYEVQQFAFGNIPLGNQSIWITFDEKVTTNLVGYDIIRQISRMSPANSDKEYFFPSQEEMKEFIVTA